MTRKTELLEELFDETFSRGYGYIASDSPETWRYNATNILICNRESYDLAHSGEYLVCVWYDHDTEAFSVFDGYAKETPDESMTNHYEVTNKISEGLEFSEAFDIVDRLFENGG